MKYKKFTKHEKKANRKAQVERAMGGSGLYLYENNSDADLTLPRPTNSGIRKVGPRQQFQGDDYYMQLVKSGFLRYIKELQSPEQEMALLEKEENMSNEPEKLILDQPETITEAGQVEHVQGDTPLGEPEKLNESGSGSDPQPDVLINESPVDGGFVIVED